MGNIDIRKIVGTGIKLLLICLLVGWVLSVIDIDALGFIRFLSQSVRNAGEIAADAVRWGVPYILLGAVLHHQTGFGFVKAPQELELCIFGRFRYVPPRSQPRRPGRHCDHHPTGSIHDQRHSRRIERSDGVLG